MGESNFVIRVYGIFIHAEKGLLVSDELILGKKYTKFPGGGMEFGEGTIECLEREMKEETGSVFRILTHFYTTDFFVSSAFREKEQVISIYYLMEPLDELDIKSFENGQEFRFIGLDKLIENDFQLPIDRHVARLILKHHAKSQHERSRLS